ncbi:hypothetical protein AN642_01640 [Epulopiscium sp. SCG-B10WGA-EpuloA2]|nr:hypothetical protein AN642_01640 [Epulopiscium sp. SCG-B10WGA-EpuloA2]
MKGWYSDICDIILIIIFEYIVVMHELGHYCSKNVWRWCVNEFAIGIGPKLWGIKKGETLYSIRLLPIGGYCAMEGENEDK